MKSSIKLKVAAMGLAFGIGITNANASGPLCESMCDSWAWSAQQSYCASIRAGSACASSEPLHDVYVQQCLANCNS
ncbi:MAG: hypothetical protein ACI8WB_001671 [Phenylobacterium sp.]|jgi:hypothetical protein